MAKAGVPPLGSSRPLPTSVAAVEGASGGSGWPALVYARLGGEYPAAISIRVKFWPYFYSFVQLPAQFVKAALYELPPITYRIIERQRITPLVPHSHFSNLFTGVSIVVIAVLPLHPHDDFPFAENPEVS